MIRGVEVDKDKIELAHLQFGDTLIFIPKEENLVLNYKRMFDCFEVMTTLSINYRKSDLISCETNVEWVKDMRDIIHYQYGKLKMVYLDLPLGVTQVRFSFVIL